METRKKHKIRIEFECDSCSGTGLYRGMGERDGFAVVCHHCEGTGKAVHTFSYYKFEGRHRTNKIEQVLEVNPGICVGRGTKEQHLPKEPVNKYGGIPYKDWFGGKGFPKGSEMRKYTCPCWWFQSADYKKKPEWDECRVIGSFSECAQFKNKTRCWEKFDKVGPGKK